MHGLASSRVKVNNHLDRDGHGDGSLPVEHEMAGMLPPADKERGCGLQAAACSRRSVVGKRLLLLLSCGLADAMAEQRTDRPTDRLSG